MRLSIIGTGHVGLVTGACLADKGNQVICVDNDDAKISSLKAGRVPIHEPGLEEMVRSNVALKRLSFTTAIAEGVKSSDVVFITVGTPPGTDGGADLTAVERVSREIARSLNSYKVVVEKSTVPVKTGEWVRRTLSLFSSDSVDFDVASVPEFLREGSAVHDFLHPDRVVIGVESPRAEAILRQLFEPLGAPILVTNISSAELIKHASNSFLALKISYINAVATLCDALGADVQLVAQGIGLDPRIGERFLQAGLGYGGPCFPKDVAAFIKLAEEAGFDFKLLKAAAEINSQQRGRLLKKLKDALWTLRGKRIGVLGLSFKPNTDDMRDAPSVEIVRALLAEGAEVRAYDPAAMDNARHTFG